MIYLVSDNGGLTKEQKAELQKMIDELNDIAKDVFRDYTENPSELSGSITQIHENSPLLDKALFEKAIDERKDDSK